MLSSSLFDLDHAASVSVHAAMACDILCSADVENDKNGLYLLQPVQAMK